MVMAAWVAWEGAKVGVASEKVVVEVKVAAAEAVGVVTVGMVEAAGIEAAGQWVAALEVDASVALLVALVAVGTTPPEWART